MSVVARSGDGGGLEVVSKERKEKRRASAFSTPRSLPPLSLSLSLSLSPFCAFSFCAFFASYLGKTRHPAEQERSGERVRGRQGGSSSNVGGAWSVRRRCSSLSSSSFAAERTDVGEGLGSHGPLREASCRSQEAPVSRGCCRCCGLERLLPMRHETQRERTKRN